MAQEERYRLGLTLSEADDTLRAHLRLAAGEGLVVTDVIANCAAAESGIQQHDVLIVLDGQRLTTVETVNAQIQEIKDKSVELRLLRGAEDVTIQIAPRKTQETAFTDKALTHWDLKNCQRCHANPWEPHARLSERLQAAKSVWTDGHSTKLFLYPYALEAAVDQERSHSTSQQQIDALKLQLAEMQKTLEALETTLAPAQIKANEKDE
jgi:acetolactate synthase regulatory subunit